MTARKTKPLLFCSSRYDYMFNELLASKVFEAGVVARSLSKAGVPEIAEKSFPDGEWYLKLLTEVEDRDVVLVGGTTDDKSTFDFYDLASVIVAEGARSLRMVILYYGYSTQERGPAGEAIKANYRARMISGIPKAQLGNRLYLFDLHNEGMEHYFGQDLNTRHIYGKTFVVNASKRLIKPDEHFVLASTDAGRAKWVQSIAEGMKKQGMPVQSAFIIKRRRSGSETEVQDISAEVAGKPVVIYDDMIRTGGSLVNAAKAYLDKGALSVVAIATHGVLPGESLAVIQSSGVLQKVIVTNSHPRAVELAPKVAPFGHTSEDGFFEVVSCSNLVCTYLTKGARYAQEHLL